MCALHKLFIASFEARFLSSEQTFDKTGVRVTRASSHGEPSLEIIGKVREHKADQIVMGSRGLGQIGGLILGSVSERVLHGAHVLALIVR
jgi:nucleotide-binding universal stress UspA family protein